MALSKEMASRIVAVVTKDTKSREAIEGKPGEPKYKWFNPYDDVLRFSNWAGAARNVELLLLGKDVNDPEVSNKLCIGIVARTVEAIHKEMKAGRLPEVTACASAHRVRNGVHHDGTSIRTNGGDQEYIFDWHATLTVEDPAISTLENWLNGSGAVNYVFFRGIK